MIQNKTKSLIPQNAINIIIKKSAELSASRKKRNLPSILPSLENYNCKSFTLHETGTNILSLDNAPRDSPLLALGGHDGKILVFDRSCGAIVSSREHGKNGINSIHFFNDSHILMSASIDGTVKIWKGFTNGNFEMVSCLPTDRHDIELVSAFVHPTYTYIITVRADGEWQIWDIAKADIVASIKEDGLRCSSPATRACTRYSAANIHPDGLLLGIGTHESTIKLFDYRTAGSEVACFPKLNDGRHTGCVSDLAFSENGYLMSSSADDGVRIWDLRKLLLLNHIETNRPVNAIRYDNTGSYLAVCSMGLRVFRTKQEYPIVADFNELKNENLKAVCFGHDASFIAVGSEDQNLKIFS